MTDTYDVLILGGGPIGAATAYFLMQKGGLKVGLLRREPNDDPEHVATYKWAGGSVRWFWDDPEKTAATKETADFIKDLVRKGADFSLLEDNYLFLNRGAFVPAINVASTKLIDYLLEGSRARGLEITDGIEIENVEKSVGGYVVTGGGKQWIAKKVLLALGVNNNNFIEDLGIEEEKRELFVLDTPVDDARKDFPHTIFPIGEGVAYVFIKKFPEGLRFVVGQEDVVEAGEERGENNYFQELLDAGLAERLPFIKDAKVEKVLWGIDSGNKTLNIHTTDNALYAVNAGSAVRSCVYIGRTLAEILKK